jgi:bacillithiol synthase
MEIDIEVGELRGSRLVEDYLRGSPEAAAFFAGQPDSIAAFRDRMDEVAARFGPEQRRTAAAALRPTSENARRRLERFVEQGGAVVTTGQQAGLFTGPLYTVHKALTTIRLAEALETTLGVTVLPVFWTASEDHDWDEVNHAYLLDRDDRVRRLEAGSADRRPLPMSQRRFDAELDNTLADLSHILAGYDHAEEVLRHVRQSYLPGATVAGAFRRLVESIFASFDLLTTDAAEPALKQASQPLLERELDSVEEHGTLLRETAAGLTEAGYTPQVPILDGASNLFVHTEHGRERLVSTPRGWRTRESGSHFSTSRLRELLRAEPGRFSPNVLLRPVVESQVFPVLAYVAGPGEISYFAQLGSLFAAHGIAMPLVYPRASIRLVEPRARRRLEEVGLSPAELRTPRHELVREHSRERVPVEIEDALRAVRESTVHGFDRLAAETASLDPGLRGMVGARRNRALLLVAEAEARILRAVARREHGWEQALDAVRAHLVPLDSEQERVLNVLPFLAHHGLGLLDAIAAAIPARWTDAPAGAAVPASDGTGGKRLPWH